VHGLFLFVLASYLCARVIGDWRQDPLLRRFTLTLRYSSHRRRLKNAAGIVGVRGLPVSTLVWVVLGLLVLLEVFFVVPGLAPFTQPKPDVIEVDAYAYRGLAVFALGLPMAILGLLLIVRPALARRPTERLWSAEYSGSP
jgi:hypothetical protein